MHSGAVLPSSSPVSNPAPNDVVENETTPGRECDLLGDLPTPPSSPILLDRLDDLAFNDVNYPFSDDSDEMVGDDDGDEWANGEGMGDDGEGMGPFAAVNEDGERAPGESARLDKLHVGLGGKVLEGGETFCRLNTKAKNSEYYPYENLSVMLMYQLVHKYQFSEATLEGVLTILGTVHDGKGFEIKDLRGLSAKHFYSRRRVHHPLLEVVETKVPTSKDDQELVPVYDIPCNLLIDRRMQSPSFIDTCTTHPGGKLVREEAARNGLSSDHLFSLPELPKDNARSSNMHGVLARSSAFFGLDGLLGTQGNQKIHVADVAMCVVEGVARPCRILEMYWDCEEEAVLVSVRRFRRKAEVRDVTGRERRAGLERLWEEYGRGSKIVVHNEDVLALAEIYTLDELSSSLRRKEQWEGGGRCAEWGGFVGEGFASRVRVRAQQKRRREAEEPRTLPEFVASSEPWSWDGTRDEPLFGIRKPGFRHNKKNLPFASLPLCVYNDAFNAWMMTNKHSVGATYFGWGWTSNEVQRRRAETLLGTIATPGACVEGEMSLQASVMGELQRGCEGIARIRTTDGVVVPQQVFFRGGLLLLTSDSPQRAKILYCKHPNNTTHLPCPYCKVQQNNVHPTGGDLGNPRYNVRANRRTWGEAQDGWKELLELQSDVSKQTERSAQLGMVPPTRISSGALGRPLWDKMFLDPRRHVPAESLHADALGAQALMQVFAIGLLSEPGCVVVSSIIRQGGALYPPATARLKDICSNYKSLKGSDKWLLGSIILLVFRVVLHDAKSLGRYVKSRELAKLVQKWGNAEAVLAQLRKLMQVASALTFAVRSPDFSDAVLNKLQNHAKDTVGVYAEILGRAGARTTVHSALHYAEAIVDHGRMPDASTGEAAHQMNKKVNKSNSGRNAAAHYIRRFNMDLAIDALAEEVPWKVTRYDRTSRADVVSTVRPGPACSVVLRSLRHALPGGLSSAPTDIRAASTPSAAESRGQFRGAARWSSVLWKPGPVLGGGTWEARVSRGRFRPDEATLIAAYNTYFGCGRVGEGASCENARCPSCWGSPEKLDQEHLECSRFQHGAPPHCSSGLGRWKGGDVKAASQAGPPDAWAFGENCGEDVEFYKGPRGDHRDGPVSTRELSMARILYFFDHRGNQRFGGTDRPVTSWVLAFDFVSDGVGARRSPDPITLHPVMVLRGRGRPVVFPAASIRRHVHMYHRCSGSDHPPADSAWICGPQPPEGGGAKVWRHKLRLATPGPGPCDRFLLNEFHHSINRDPIA